jgi:hypothetical protein
VTPASDRMRETTGSRGKPEGFDWNGLLACHLRGDIAPRFLTTSFLGSNPSSAPYLLCDYGWLTYLLCASILLWITLEWYWCLTR